MILLVVTVVMVINLVLYHKLFHVLYFDLGKGLLKEIVGAYLAALFEIGIVMTIGKSLLGGVVNIVGWIFKLIVIAVVVVAVICIVCGFAKIIREKVQGRETDITGTRVSLQANKTQADKSTDTYMFSGNDEYGNDKNRTKMSKSENKKVRYCAYCGKEIAENSMFCNFCGKEKWIGKN